MRLSVVIPCRNGGVPVTTLNSLSKQAYWDYSIVIQPDYVNKGACWARNEGFKSVSTELVLFCDDDITWLQDGITDMVNTLDDHPEASYSYGSYITQMAPGGALTMVGDQEFDAAALRMNNYISTMSVLRTRDFPGFDPSLRRLQDWDVWLTLLGQGKTGVYCGSTTFKTVTAKDGITFGTISWEEAYRTVRRKHKL